MKTKLSIIAALVCAAVQSQAATLVFTNSNGTSTNAITNSAGVAFQGTAATFAVGYFTISDSAITGATSAATLISSFVNFGGQTSTFTLAGPPTQNNRGFTTLNAPAVTIAGSEFAGKNMYIFVRTAGDTEFGVFKSTLLFDAADDPTLPNVTKLFTSANVPNQNILLGGTGFSVPTSNPDVTPNQSWNTVALIPEPSAALLGAIGALGLLRRRRN